MLQEYDKCQNPGGFKSLHRLPDAHGFGVPQVYWEMNCI